MKETIQKNCHKELIHLQEVVYFDGKTIESLKWFQSVNLVLIGFNCRVIIMFAMGGGTI